MIGLLFLGVVAAWVFASWWLAMRATGRLSRGGLRIAVVIAVTALLVPLPVADEIVGGFQFRALCAQDTLLKVDAEKIRGKTVRVNSEPANMPVASTAVRILFSRALYRDVVTNEVLASSDRYVADGGWLMRLLMGEYGSTPLTFPSTCSGKLKLADFGSTLTN
jgi:hypothetical protein